MSLIGSLEQFDLANILRRIEVFSKTGLLVVKQGELWVEFYFRQGQLVCVGPVRANVTLIDRLLQANLLAPQVLPQVRAIVSPGETNETQMALALINEGLLSREVLRAWSSHETSQILQAIFSWPQGEIYFEDDRPTPADRLLIALSISALLEALPPAALAPRSAAVGAPSTDELKHTPEYFSHVVPAPSAAPLIEVGPGGQMRGGPSYAAPAPAQGTLNASQLIEQPPMFNQPQTPMNGGGMLNASQLIEDFPFNTAGAGGPVNAAQLVENVPSPSFASANPAAIFGTEIDISASTQISILPPQPVRNPLPPARIDTSFMTPELILAPVDLSTLRERNPQVQLTPDQWSLFALIDGQVSLQLLCQALNAPAEQVCMVAGELMAIGLVMPLNSATGILNELMSPSAQYPAYTPPAMMSMPNPFTSSVEMQAQGIPGQYGSYAHPGNGWQQSQTGSMYAPAAGYR